MSLNNSFEENNLSNINLNNSCEKNINLSQNNSSLLNFSSDEENNNIVNDHNPKKIDISAVCQSYNNKHKINMIYCDNNEEINIDYNTGVILVSTQSGEHWFGAYLIKKDDILYCIISDTFPQFSDYKPINNFLQSKTKEDKIEQLKIIHICKGLQKDNRHCMVYALKTIEQLAKNNGQLAISLINFLNQNNKLNTNDITLDINNEEFKKCEFSGEFIKLSQSSTLQKQYGDKKVTIKDKTNCNKTKTNIDNYLALHQKNSNDCKCLSAEDFEHIKKNKNIPTKIYSLAHKYLDITTNK